MFLLCSSVPVKSWQCDTSQRKQDQHPETVAAKWDSATVRFIISTCDFATVTRSKAIIGNAYM